MTSSSILFITAFKDLNRETWKLYSRNKEVYFEKFCNYALNTKYKTIVYIENDMLNKCLEILKNKNRVESFPEYIIFKDLNLVDTFLNKYESTEQTIINSDSYKNKIPPSRKLNPEHIYASYNLINHSKINFVKDAKDNYPNYEFYSWIDFGINDIPSLNLNLENSLYNKVTYALITKLPNSYIHPDIMLSSEIIFFAGSQFIVHKNVVDDYKNKYEEILLELQKQNVSDDDQNVVLQIYFKYKDLFNPIYIGSWFSLFSKFLNN